MGSSRVILCGSFGREKRSECPHALHDWPMFSGYTAAHEEASARLSRGWRSVRCKACGLYGWVPGRVNDEVLVPHPTTPAPRLRVPEPDSEGGAS